MVVLHTISGSVDVVISSGTMTIGACSSTRCRESPGSLENLMLVVSETDSGYALISTLGSCAKNVNLVFS